MSVLPFCLLFCNYLCCCFICKRPEDAGKSNLSLSSSLLFSCSFSIFFAVSFVNNRCLHVCLCGLSFCLCPTLFFSLVPSLTLPLSCLCFCFSLSLSRFFYSAKICIFLCLSAHIFPRLSSPLHIVVSVSVYVSIYVSVAFVSCCSCLLKSPRRLM